MPRDTSHCSIDPVGRRRIFWSTQPDCGSVEACPGQTCGVPGLKRDAVSDCATGAPVDAPCATISNAEWVRGLIINILATDARKDDTECGWRPGQRGGHWSEAYIPQGPKRIGSRIRQLPQRCAINEILNLVKAYALDDLSVLTLWGVASEIQVETRYVGNNSILLAITAIGRDAQVINVGMTATRTANAWIWGTTTA